MSGTARRSGKTENLSLRLDPKTKFMLDFISRVKGQSITTAVERAITQVADSARIGTKCDSFGNEEGGSSWADFWDASEGIRTLTLIAFDGYPTTFDEDELLEMVRAHSQFFYRDPLTMKNYNRAYIDILWPNISEYVTNWRETKSKDYWAAGKTMRMAIQAANVHPPDWPPPPQIRTISASPGRHSQDLDDEIPF